VKGSKNRLSALAGIEVKTRNGLRANLSASIGRNAVDITGTGGADVVGVRRHHPS
jgi:uncharacterized protein (UPF0264 family)